MGQPQLIEFLELLVGSSQLMEFLMGLAASQLMEFLELLVGASQLM